MRIIHIIYSASFGGIEQLVHQLIATQKNDFNHEIGVLILNKKGEFLFKLEVLNVAIYNGKLTSGFDLSISKTFKIYKILKQYDIVHYHIFNPIAAIGGILSRRKLMYTEHGNFGFGRALNIFQKFNHRLKNLFLNNSIHFLSFNSDFTKDVALNKYNLKKVKMKRIYNGVDLSNGTSHSISDFKSLDISKGTFVVGTSSRFAGFKRIDRLINAFSIFAKNKTDVRLLLVGDGILRKDLEAQTQKLNISHLTIWTGFRADVRTYQNIMNVCVFPSQSEPFGLVAVETLALGKPTLVYQDGGGLIEIISKVNKQDIVNDSNEMVNRLNYYYNMDEEKSNIINQRKEVSSYFSMDKMATNFNLIYQDLLMDVRN